MPIHPLHALIRFVAIPFTFILAAGAGAQITFDRDSVRNERPLGLSISGGISLGSYQAGVNFGLLEMYRHAAWDSVFRRTWKIPAYRLRSVTGASAGNINTLLWAVEACTDLREGDAYRSPEPDSSLFWQVWLAIGWDRLFNDTSAELALFDRKALIDDLVAPALMERMRDPRLVEDCRVPAGITLTRILPDTLRLQRLGIETQRHVTVFNVLVDSERADLGTRVRFLQEDRIRPEDQYFGLLVRLQPHDGDIPVRNLLNAVKASASFPVAFAPVRLDVWYPKKGSDTDAFSDGGVFDNNPVGLTRNLYGLQGDSATLDILYVNPGHYRGDLATARRVAEEQAPSGGLAAVMRLLQGAVPTARQYELQLLARERAHQARVDTLQEQLELLRTAAGALRTEAARRGLLDDARLAAMLTDTLARPTRERLLLSSRAYPVLGEHLAYFAAFLARPGREFDFYVGMYDGLYMALSEHTCAGSGDGSDRERRRCVGERLPELIRNANLVHDPARQVLSWLYAAEHPPLRVDVRPAPDSLRQRVKVQRAFFDALGTRFEPVDAFTECGDARLVHVLLCRDGLLQVLESIGADDEVAGIIDAWSRRCAGECRAEPIFRELVNEPMHGGTVLLDDIFARLLYVEEQMKNRPGLHGGDYVAALAAGQWLFRATHLRSRPVRELRPNSVPEGSLASWIPVSYLGANLGTAGVEARYQPAWNFRNRLFMRGNAILHYNGEPRRSRERTYGGVGTSLGWYVNNVAVSEFTLGGNLYQPLGDLRWDTGHPAEVELSGVFAANQLRLSWRWLPDGDHRGLIHGRAGWALSAGLNDPVGLIYWITRINN